MQQAIGTLMRSAIGAAVSRGLKVMRFGDNMREVAVTEGDKVEAQIKLGWQVNTWPVGQLVDVMDRVLDADVDHLLEQYRMNYSIDTEDRAAIRYQAREEVALRTMLEAEGARAFTNTFENLYGMRQLPGLATQDLMRQGYGYGGEGDWKVAALTAVMKAMTADMNGGTSFMEDYTYDLKSGLSLGAHMLEVCPSLAADKARIEVHPLGIGGREPPARLVFEGREGAAVQVSLVDMGGRMRMIVQDVRCVRPIKTMPNLPVARVMWQAFPDLETAAHCWILAGGAHHTVLSYDCDAEMMRDFARIMDMEFVHIGAGSDPVSMERDLELSDLLWNQRAH